MRRALAASCRLLPLGVLPLLAACRGERSAGAEAHEVTLELGPGSLDLTERGAGLAELAGYESALTVSFDGSKAGQPLRWSRTSTFQATKSPPARRLAFTGTGGADPGASFMAERNGAAYAWSGDGPCSATLPDSADPELGRMEPAAALPGVLGAEEAGTETVNGVKATRYTFDERALGESGINQSTGELWLASAGGYVVRYRLTTTGDTGYFRDGTRGTLTWDYQLTRTDRPPAIELPPACPPGLVEAPRLPDASGVESHPGVLHYRTAGTVADAAAFYQQQLSAQGWKRPDQSNPRSGTMEQVMADPQIREAMKDPQVRKAMEAAGLTGMMQLVQPAPRNPDEAYLLFQRGGRSMRVRITRADSATDVLVLGGAGN